MAINQYELNWKNVLGEMREKKRGMKEIRRRGEEEEGEKKAEEGGKEKRKGKREKGMEDAERGWEGVKKAMGGGDGNPCPPHHSTLHKVTRQYLVS